MRARIEREHDRLVDEELAQAPTNRLVVTANAPLEHVARRLGDGVGLETVGANRCRITIHGDTIAWLAFRLILLDADFEIHEPAELIPDPDRLAGRLRRTAVRS